MVKDVLPNWLLMSIKSESTKWHHVLLKQSDITTFLFPNGEIMSALGFL